MTKEVKMLEDIGVGDPLNKSSAQGWCVSLGSASCPQPVQESNNQTPQISEMKEKNKQIVPFLKWAGGKRWLIQKYPDLFKVKFGRYIEPFVGSGAVFFHLKPRVSILSDKNTDLINAYNAIKINHKKVVDLLREHHILHSENHYYKVRDEVYGDMFMMAARFIYLNRTCWNGLYRVNKSNKFNVPKGSKKNVIIDTDDFEATADALKSTDLLDCDFSLSISQARDGDLLFVDPPYTVKHDKNGFIKYNEVLFSWEDQVRLRDAVMAAKNRGAKVILTNANHDSVRALYEGFFELEVLDRSSVLSGKKENRGPVKELLVKC